MSPLERPNAGCAERVAVASLQNLDLNFAPKNEGSIGIRSIGAQLLKYTLSVPGRPECGRCRLFNLGVHIVDCGLVLVIGQLLATVTNFFSFLFLC